MKISEKTIQILKNFSTINQSILVHPGNVIKTIAGDRTIFSKADVQENFPKKFSIYELSKFLGAISLFKEPEFEFFDDHLKISEGNNFIRYAYADESLIVTPPNKEIELPSKDIVFDLNERDLSTILKAVSVLQVPEVSISGEDGAIYIKAINNKNASSDRFQIAVGVTDQSFNAIFNASFMKFLPANYKVALSKSGFAQFTSDGLIYWIAADQNSKFGV